MQEKSPQCVKYNWVAVGSAVTLFGLIVWTFWPAISDMAEKWQSDPQYSHGYLIPVFAIGVAYSRRKKLDVVNCRIDWRVLIPLATGAGMYVAGGLFFFDYASAIALLPTLLGAVLLLGGSAAARWSLPMIAFLAFMVPLPFAFETALGRPLQSLATGCSTWVLQTLGFPAVSEGNIILLERGRISVIEACSGLSMLLTFGAMAVALAMVINRPLLDRAIIVSSTIPVAIAVNVARISGNGIAIEFWGPDAAHKWFHDQGGWLMMPLALGLLGLELWILGRLLIVPLPKAAIPILGLTPQPRKAVATSS